MAYDEELAARIQELVADEPALTEKKMFGGLAFLIGGNMAIAQSDELVAATPARLMEMRGREMAGWLRVDGDDVRQQPELARWVALGTAYARSLPSKQ